MQGLSLVAASGGHSSSRCAGLSQSRPLLLRSTGSRRAGSVVVAHGLSCSVACGIFPDQGSNPCPLHWQADSQPLRHQGSPIWEINSKGGSQTMTQCRNLLTGGHLAAACTPLLTGNSLPYKVAHHIFSRSYHPLPLLIRVMMCRKIALLSSC